MASAIDPTLDGDLTQAVDVDKANLQAAFTAARDEISALQAGGAVTFEILSANGDVGTGATQVAQGNHTHSYNTLTDLPTLTAAAIGAQPENANLTAFAGLSGVADRLAYFTAANTLALTTFTSSARQLLDDTSFTNMRTTLGAAALGANTFTGAQNFNGQTVTGQLATQANATGSIAGTASGRTLFATGNITGVPVTAGWHAAIRNKSGSNKTITPASGTCIKGKDGTTAATVTIANNKSVFVEGDGINLFVDGDVV